MSDLYLPLKFLHILGATALFGTGAGIAFFMWMAHRTRDSVVIAATARTVVIADALFTATAVIVQPVTGYGLMLALGLPVTESWIVVSLALYVLVGLCWLPVIWIQLRMWDLAAEAARDERPLPPRYFRLFRIWFRLGWPAFIGVLAIVALMIWKPALW
ncbi:MAG: DUF2269 family protein [Rhizobiales bacterium]|nr:DUF2269 family protein [Hyphomicrobiales bacterium]